MITKKDDYTLKIYKQKDNIFCEIRRKQNNNKHKQPKLVAFCMLDEWHIRLMKKMRDIKRWKN